MSARDPGHDDQPPRLTESEQLVRRAMDLIASAKTMPQCPQCGVSALVKIEGCNNCLECGYSKCG